MKRIAIEEHFFTQDYLDYLKSRKEFPRFEIFKDAQGNKVEKLEFFTMDPGAIDALLDVGEGRIKHMDEAGIDMQVLSLMNPGVELFDAATGTTMAKKANDDLAKIIKRYPKRFAGFAALGAQDPRGAVHELERAVKELGLKGAKINSHIHGEFLDKQKYWIIFEMAEKLDVPIYIHPRIPPEDMLKCYIDYPALSGSMLGFAAETGLHAMRLICSGIFDKYPGLKIILGHLGEALPHWMWRMDSRFRREGSASDPAAGKLKKRPSQYLKDNFMVTTSGMFWYPPFLSTYLALGADQIMFAVDHPLESSHEAVTFMDAVPISDTDKEKIYHGNAEKLLRL
jgi:5-carboxyvanillate decarboxylase